MNASFPYISPAVSLPVDPPRRVVDAGYYDNYGVNLAAAWAYMNREWICGAHLGPGLGADSCLRERGGPKAALG